jgi:hypothetical protein
MQPSNVRDAARRIRQEFVARPTLQLSPKQAQSQWGFDEHVCLAVLDVLVHLGFLWRTATGAYTRRDPPAGAVAQAEHQ